MTGENKDVAIPPVYAAALAISALAVLYILPLAAVGAVVTGVVGRKRPWVLASATVVLAWALMQYLLVGSIY
jgi:hypothetical protein